MNIKIMNVIAIRKNKDPYGWLGNMSPYLINFNGLEYKTSEALFQALRFKDKVIQEAIRNEKNPMGAKDIMRQNEHLLIVKKHSAKDVLNMKMCLYLKLEQHPVLKQMLKDTGDAVIHEDVTNRGDVGGNLFWGAMLVNGEWVGESMLGKLWMELRNTL